MWSRAHMVLLLVALALGAAGCGLRSEGFFVDSNDKPYKPSDWKEVKSHYPAYRNGKLGTQWNLEIRDPHGLFQGSARMTSLTGRGPAVPLLRRLGHVRTAGRINEIYVSATGGYAVSGSALLRGRTGAGDLCLAYRATSVRGRGDQLWQGTFRITGGRGPAARLHGSGRFLTLRPSLLKDYFTPFAMYFEATFDHVSTGQPQSFGNDCRKATTPYPPPPVPKQLNATLAGVAFAPTGAQSLPAGTTIYPTNAPINGAVGCGAANDLYAVIDYSGPPGGKVEGYSTRAFTQTLHAGRNVVWLASAPSNGTLEVKSEVSAGNRYTPVALIYSITLSRTC